MLIESGIGNGRLAGIDDDNRLLTASFNIPFEHLIAKDYQKTFTVLGTSAAIANGVSESVLYLENDNEDSTIVINRALLQTVGATYGANDYFTLETNAEYSTGGSAASINNLSSGSSVTSGAIAYDGAFGLTGAPTVIDTIYPPSDRFLLDFDINGGVLILPGKGISIGYTGSNTAGFAKASIYFSVVGNDGYSG